MNSTSATSIEAAGASVQNIGAERRLTDLPLVSVVMSVYNAGARLRSSIESIQAQAGVAWEFIIVNDGSTDESGAILEDYEKRDARIRIINQENLGITKSLIRACLAARGVFIARHDARDISLPGRLREQAAELRRKSACVLAVCGVRMVLPEGVSFQEIMPDEGSRLTERMKSSMRGIPAHGSVMFRKDAYVRTGGYREAFILAQDCDLWLRLIEQGCFASVQKVLYEHHYDPASASSVRSRLQGRFARLAEEACRQRHRSGTDAVTLARAMKLRPMSSRSHIWRRYQQAGSLYRVAVMLGKKHQRLAFGYLRRSIQTCPWYWRSWPRVLRTIIGKDDR